MKFENPIMTISMFEVENIVTDSTTTTEEKLATAVNAANNNELKNVTNVLTFAF